MFFILDPKGDEYRVCQQRQRDVTIPPVPLTPKGEAAIKRLATVPAEHLLPPRLIAVLERLHAHIRYLMTR
ncbi:hypothetical protein WT83_28965 [Burkholderia territorii]|uniref:Uncharacterized protein n=1 Tax=Burkholderia territorii TaxID=1503055 RepID=A0A125K3T2_9BURK|nr:hypothetical protein WT83_28965 [Burkholderia territorii]